MTRSVASSIIRVTKFFDDGFVAAEVCEPSGLTHEWILAEEVLPPAARRRPARDVLYMQGDKQLYTEASQTRPFRMPFWKLLEHQKRGKARRKR